MPAATTLAIVGASLAATAATTSSITASQRQSDAADKAKKLQNEADAQRAINEKVQKKKEKDLALGALANAEANRKAQPTGGTLPNAIVSAPIGGAAGVGAPQKNLIGG